MAVRLTAEQALARAAGWRDIADPDARGAVAGRRLVGLVGPPGVGKSTFAAALTAAASVRADRTGAAPPPVALVPMDGFHLAQTELERRGLADRKGAPETFDADGLVATLQRVRAGHSTYVPSFDRSIEEPIAGALLIDARTPLVIVEGNYLLLETSPWNQVADLLVEVWYLDLDDDVRRARLRDRHVSFGRTPSEAQRWVASVDEPNAAVIAASRARADLVVDLNHWEPPAAAGRADR